MTKVSIVTLIVGIILYFTGKQHTISIVLMVLGAILLLGAIIWSNKRGV